MSTVEPGQLWHLGNGRHDLDYAVFVVRVEDERVWTLPFRADVEAPGVQPRDGTGGLEGYTLVLHSVSLGVARDLTASRTVLKWLTENEALSQAAVQELRDTPLFQIRPDGTLGRVEVEHVWMVIYPTGGLGATFPPDRYEVAVQRATDLGGWLVRLPVEGDYRRPSNGERARQEAMARDGMAPDEAHTDDLGPGLDNPVPEGPFADPNADRDPAVTEQMLDKIRQRMSRPRAVTLAEDRRIAFHALAENGPEMAQEPSEVIRVPGVLNAVRWCLLSHAERLSEPRWQEKDQLAGHLLGDLAEKITALRPKLDPEEVGEFVEWCTTTREHVGTTWEPMVEQLRADYGIG